jgi:NTP pyrophosphatase (non-canonical NTP hydrolase)
MKLNKLIKEAHENSIRHGFYDCPDCKGSKKEGGLNGNAECVWCDGTGIIKNANIPEKLMLIVSELGEAQEALRKNRLCPYKFPDHFDERCFNKYHFEVVIKDTFEDEIADVYIRLADLCGYLKIEPLIEEKEDFSKIENISEILFKINTAITTYNTAKNMHELHIWSAICFIFLDALCEKTKIDIEKHITAKMAYNATRPYKHGKEF